MKKTFIALAVGHALVGVAYADDNSAVSTTISIDEAGRASYQARLPDEKIVVTPFSQQMGTQQLTSEQIAKRPTANGSINELLKSNPNVQFANATNSSLMGGELEPEKISFHGEKFYNNNYMIDGLSNNNNIDPASNNAVAGGLPTGYNAWDLPAGGEQSLWINSRLLDSVEVFDSNVSAKYGDFTGGVVDAKIKNPRSDRASGYISYRTTSDDLTSFHIHNGIKGDFESAGRLYYQPRFTKQTYSASINQPVNDKLALLFSYDRTTSKIPFYQDILGEWRDQERQTETYLIKGNYKANNGDTISATAMYAPHSSLFYRRNIKDSGFENAGGGYRLNVDWKHLADWGKVTSVIGYQKDENKVTNESDHYYPWWHKYRGNTSDVITWQTGVPTIAGNQTGLQGGYGKFATESQTVTAKQDYAFYDMSLGDSTHQINAGWEYRHENKDYERFYDTSLGGMMTWNDKVICQGVDGCIDGEQFTSIRLLYPARGVSASMNKYSIYAEDNIKIGRFELTPGIRISYNDYLKNTDVSPRFAWTADVFNNDKTKLFGGWSRYHNNAIFAYKLKNGISSNFQQTRTMNADGTLTEWTDGQLKERSASKYNHDVSGLDTPYSDEKVLGLTQKIANTSWTLKWVNRDSKKSFARSQTTNEAGERIMDNSGWSKADTVTLSVSPTKPIRYSGLDLDWSFGASWSDNRQNTANTYDDTSAGDEDYAIFEGKLMQKADLPAFDYNKPWHAFLNVDMTFPDINFTWGHYLKYTAPYKGYTTTSVDCPLDEYACGNYAGRATLYEETDFGRQLTYDWRMAYKKYFGTHTNLELTMDISNVFNKKMEIGKPNNSSVITYEQGRQIWLGATYNW
ncbi:MAG: TonB-dependent receptor plug domain-containing protein [Moraxella sp.]|uniref:TonB-dependent receptor plug domain-containing protein n=1 Tax=Moraxella sp. TaxID=479 RepID=UPI0026DD9E35|nr:TonB-dependent receptor plug domain-containing protein [Moraxella sp.]MDO4450336.1 TonB-dependent receptor plug domain-containing protein [Moraxella sp.]